MEILKVLVVSDMNASTMLFIRQMSDIEAIFAELENVSVGLDFGLTKIDSSTQIYLYGTPNARHFDLERYGGFFNEVSRRGIVLIVDAAKMLYDIKLCVSFVRTTDLPYVIALHNFDQPNGLTEEGARESLDITDADTVVRCNLELMDDVRAVIVALVNQMSEDSTVRKILAKLAVQVDNPPTQERSELSLEDDESAQGF